LERQHRRLLRCFPRFEGIFPKSRRIALTGEASMRRGAVAGFESPGVVVWPVAERIVRVCWAVSVKEQVLKAIHRLPDDIDYRDVADEVALLAAVAEAERDIEEGRLVSNADMRSRLQQWTNG
jgi:hypothetical protein